MVWEHRRHRTSGQAERVSDLHSSTNRPDVTRVTSHRRFGVHTVIVEITVNDVSPGTSCWSESTGETASDAKTVVETVRVWDVGTTWLNGDDQETNESDYTEGQSCHSTKNN